MIEIYTDEDGDEWEFYQDEEGKWWWCHIWPDGKFIDASIGGYAHKADCASNAQRHNMKRVVSDYSIRREVISTEEHKARRSKNPTLSRRWRNQRQKERQAKPGIFS